MIFIEFNVDWDNTLCTIKVRGGSDSKELIDIKDCWVLRNYFVAKSIEFLGNAQYQDKQITVPYNHINDLGLLVETCRYLVEPYSCLTNGNPEGIKVVAGITKDNGTLYMPFFPKEKIDKLGKPTSFSLNKSINGRR